MKKDFDLNLTGMDDKELNKNVQFYLLIYPSINTFKKINIATVSVKNKDI